MCPPVNGFGSGRVRTVTSCSFFPLTPSGSDSTNRHSYSVAGSRSKMLPANPFGTTYCSAFSLIRSWPMRRSGSPCLHSASPFLRYDTATLALRLSSPSMRHSNPSDTSVGGSTTKVFAVERSASTAARRSAITYWGQVAFGSMLAIDCTCAVGICGRIYGRPTALWHE